MLTMVTFKEEFVIKPRKHVAYVIELFGKMNG